MKKIVCVFRLLFITILVLLTSGTVYAEEGRIVSFDNDKIVVFQQLDYMRITTSKGNLLSELETKTDIGTESVTYSTSSNIDICFILDKSGSMKNGRLEILKEAVIKLIDNLRSNFEDKSKLRIAAMTFSTGNELLFNLTECTDENLPMIRGKINSMTYNGGTFTVSAMKYAQANIWNNPIPNDTIRYTILITDGEADHTEISEVNNTINSIKNDATSGLFTVFCAEDKEVLNGRGGRSKLSELYGESDEIVFCSDENFEETITVEVFNFITERYVDIKSLKTETIQAYNAKALNENSVEAEIDDELLQGATLEMEYSFNIVTTEEIEEISIEDFITSLGFDKDAKLITANETNNTYGWNPVNDTVVTTFAPIMEKEEDGSYKRIVVKLLLNKVIAIDSDITDETNKANITIKTKSGETYTTKNLSTQGQDTYAISPSITITSPKGNNSNFNDLFVIIFTLILLVAILNIKNNNIRK
ncbi:MAG: VWA domain-containing protein [Clostridia bacterium]|nr:VWA domain-containing protein [Clostridia bacterium]